MAGMGKDSFQCVEDRGYHTFSKDVFLSLGILEGSCGMNPIRTRICRSPGLGRRSLEFGWRMIRSRASAIEWKDGM